MVRESIVLGTGILILTNFAVKILSLIYRGVLIRLMGSEGLGLSEMVMPLFSFLLVLASLGIPLAISNLISGDIKKAKTLSILKTGITMLFISSIFVTAAALLIFPLVRDYILSDPRIYLGFLLFFPSIILISVFSAYRGYFQGSHQSSFIGKSQSVEQVVRVSIGIALVYFLINANYRLSVLIGSLSVATFFAELAGGIYLWLHFKKQKNSYKTKGKFSFDIAKEMLYMGGPITVSRIATTAAITFQAVLIPKALILSGYTLFEAASLYGYFSGVALTILHLPAIVTGAITVPLIPSVAEAQKKKDIPLLHKRIRDSIMFTTYTAIPMLGFIFYFATPICGILFAAKEAGPMLALFSLGGILLYLQQPMVAVLQGLNYFKELLLCLVIGDGLYIVMLVICFMRQNFTIEMGIIAFIINDIILLTSYIILLKFKTKIKLNLMGFTFIPMAYTFCGLFGVYIIKQYLNITYPNIWEIMIFGIVFIAIYLIMLLLIDGKNNPLLSGVLTWRKQRSNRP
ncbi:MAG: polysaccharide biosynthesis protein [Clostridiales bacterium]